MAGKRSKNKRVSNKNQTSLQEVPQEVWKKWLLTFSMAPLVLGLLLIASTLLDIVVWGSLELQAVVGVFCVLVSFVASNALQKQWLLAGGWLLLTVAVWMWLNWRGTWVRGLSYIVAGLGLFLLAREFMQRFWEQQNKAKKWGGGRN